jgi:adenylosuccinate lyase
LKLKQALLVAKKMGLAIEPISTQVIPRDRHAMLFATFGVIGSSIERLAVEIRHLQRTEVREAEEFFSEGQKGSSAMPHKRNPILTENVTGLARVIRMAVAPAMENVALWHERDISHSSVERVALADACMLLDFMTQRLRGVIAGMHVYPENMARNLDLTNGLVFSSRVLERIIASGVVRSEAYVMIQRNAMDCWESGEPFQQILAADEEIGAQLSVDELADCFDVDKVLHHVDTIFVRALGAAAGGDE